MEEEKLKEILKNILVDMAAFNVLTNLTINILAEHFKLDAYKICQENGITFFINLKQGT